MSRNLRWFLSGNSLLDGRSWAGGRKGRPYSQIGKALRKGAEALPYGDPWPLTADPSPPAAGLSESKIFFEFFNLLLVFLIRSC